MAQILTKTHHSWGYAVARLQNGQAKNQTALQARNRAYQQ
jgi:hypothetical protein